MNMAQSAAARLIFRAGLIEVWIPIQLLSLYLIIQWRQVQSIYSNREMNQDLQSIEDLKVIKLRGEKHNTRRPILFPFMR